MITKEKFNLIKDKYGHWGSWAVWADAGEKPKSNVGDLKIFDNEDIVKILNPEIILIGLNISRNDIDYPSVDSLWCRLTTVVWYVCLFQRNVCLLVHW